MTTSLCVLTMALSATVAGLPGECVPEEMSTIVPDDTTGRALIGTEIAAVGNTAVASAIGEPDSSGSLYVLELDDDGWRDVVQLLPSDLGAGSFTIALGWSVAIDDGIILGGAPFFRVDDIGFFAEGAAFVFRLVDGGWEEEAILIASDAVDRDAFGVAAAVCGDLAVIGAAGVDGQAGAAYVFRFDGVGWAEEAKLQGRDTVADDLFGLSVACDGGRVYAGAVGDIETDAPGRVYAFEHDGGVWSETAVLTAWDTDLHNGFGVELDVDGDRMIVGATGDDDRGQNAGAAYIFEFDGTMWQPVVKLTAPDALPSQAFGVEVDIRGDRAVVSAPIDDELGFQSGAVYVFREGVAGWTKIAKLTASDGGPELRFGDGLAVTGNAVLIGAPRRDEPTDSTGAIYAFELCPCPADLDGSEDVGFDDLLMLLAAWGPCVGACPADLDESGDVGFTDLLDVLADWGPCP